MASPTQVNNAPVGKQTIPFLRLGITGIFMGLANLVPGVSGGTMVLALGLYDEFITAMSDVTRLKFSVRSLAVLAMLFGISFVTIVIFSRAIQYTMEMFQPGMLALFIGMTLGGAPSLYRELKPMDASSIASAVVGFVVMAAVALLLKPGVVEPNWILLFVGGIIASSAMILPGISGSYLLLVMGLYLPIIAGISGFADALRGRDVTTAVSIGLSVGIPVALGILVGLVGFSNFLKFMMERYHRKTIGFLLGLLLGSVLGLNPFQTASFEKLPRYARVAEEGEKTELVVRGYGWTAEPGNRVYQQVQDLQSDKVSVRIEETIPDSDPTPEDVAEARESGAVIIAYDRNVPKDVRKLAGDKRQGRVPLIIVPNVEFSPVKGGLVVLLVLLGLAITLALGRLGGKKEAVA